jgi:hypothetical protein
MYIEPTAPDVLCEALHIAMNYLRRTGRADDYRYVEAMAMNVILEAYRNGMRHRIALADKAIVCVERHHDVMNYSKPLTRVS